MSEGLGSLLGGLLGGGGTGSGGSNILQSLLRVAGSQSGGLGGLLSKLTGGGSPVAGQAQSWVSTGENQQISPDQAEKALGSDTVAEVAQQAGVSQDEAKDQLAQQLPNLVDKISPNGHLPDLGELSGQLGKLLGR
jgi:uncharacterized protein YidB (DUF937 family)